MERGIYLDPARTLAPELAFDTDQAARAATRFLAARLAASGLGGYVQGLSGGVDSACAAALAVRAVGAERLTTAKLPTHASAAASVRDAELNEDLLGIPRHQRVLVDITPMLDGWRAALGEEDGAGGALALLRAGLSVEVVAGVVARYHATAFKRAVPYRHAPVRVSG